VDPDGVTRPHPRDLDHHDCYELAAQDADRVAQFIDAVLGREGTARRPLTLREDFSGTCGVARSWARQSPHHQAIAIDLDAEPLARASGVPRVRTLARDVRRVAVKADAISATNFPLGYFHARVDLMRYLRATRSRLHARGVFIADTYGGPTAFALGTSTQSIRLGRLTSPPCTLVKHWEQREADPITGLVTDALHFEIRVKGRVMRRLRDAFVYRWRLWTVAELREAMLEAGFARVEIYTRLVEAIDHLGHVHVSPVNDPDELRGDHVAWLVARR
jgi:hypothetical protein